MPAEHTIFITSPLEPEHVERLRAVDPERVEVIYEPDMLPPTRYVGDHNGVPDFQRTEEQKARWDEHIRNADILFDFPGGSLMGEMVMDAAPNLKWVQTTSAGVGQMIVRMGLQDSDLIVTTASGVHAGPLAEYVFMVLLNQVKDMDLIRKGREERTWERYCTDELEGKTLAIVGAGKIGRRVARIARAFGMTTHATVRTATPERAGELGVDQVYAPGHHHEMLGQADAVVLCVPHTPDTEDMIDAEAIAAMKDGVMLVNIARGQVVDEDALLAALQSGKIGFAALDVFRTEPLPPDSPFWDLPNCLISPHSASTGYGENGRITDIFVHNLRCYLDGRLDEMQNVLDKQRMY
ncbi:D-2-hydroxyacid dehydrogenase [soil metagenome]